VASIPLQHLRLVRPHVLALYRVGLLTLLLIRHLLIANILWLGRKGSIVLRDFCLDRFKLFEVLLRVRSNLHACTSTHVRLDFLPVLSIEFVSFHKKAFFLLGPPSSRDLFLGLGILVAAFSRLP